jgi:hypothetical protein
LPRRSASIAAISATTSSAARASGYSRDLPNFEGSALATPREGDWIALDFWHDAQTNEVLREAKLHADALLLHVKPPGRRHRTLHHFILDTNISPKNTARTCRGAPAT